MVLPYHRSYRQLAEGPALCSKPLPRLESECPDFRGWVLDSSDEFALRNGCWFDPVMGGYAVWWIERYCRLYEDRWAGEPAVQHGCKTCGRSWVIPRTYDAEQAIERAADYVACVAAGHELCWQYGFVMRLFGWLRWSEEFQKPIRRFKRADFWVPKKNMKSPELAFIGWHLLCGDGVQGNHVYFGAKDGSQAKEIVGNHVVAAWEYMPEFRDSVQHKINEMALIHVPTRSTMKPLSSSNERNTKSKEGLNGSILIDEVHVVDAEFMKRIRRAGISRMEPMLIGGSTAGLDVMGYGKERQDYGKDVANGRKNDDEYLFLCFEADQKLDLEAISEDEAVELGRACNPAWGITIQEREFRTDFRESRNSTLDALADFGTYRLNIWQQTAAPWLSKAHWDACGEDFELSELAGRRCDLGLDMSQTRDMTAAVLVFDELEGRRTIWPMFWLPENTAAKHASTVPNFHFWTREGLISTTDQDTISQAQVLAELQDVLAIVDCTRVYYDPTHADWITEQLAKKKRERLVFPQTLKHFAPCTEAVEADILSRKLLHPQHPVLDWQAGHVNVYRHLSNRQKRPIKPNEKNWRDPRTIDGIVALTMAYTGVLDPAPKKARFVVI